MVEAFFLKQLPFYEAHLRQVKSNHPNPVFMHPEYAPLQSTGLTPPCEYGLIWKVCTALTINAYGVSPPRLALAVLDLVGTIFSLILLMSRRQLEES